jgi:exopolysaccharide biosynthesis polyprenyl glycosylphosphotransferase
MKKSELVFSAALVPVDFLGMVASAMLVFALRVSEGFSGIRPVFFDLGYREFLGIVLVTIPIFILIFALLGLYNLKTTRSLFTEFGRVIVGVTAGVMLVILLVFLDRDLFSSRFIVLTFWPLAIFVVMTERVVMRMFQRWVVARYGYGVYRVILIGKMNQEETEVLEREFAKRPSLGYRVKGILRGEKIDFLKLQDLAKDKRVEGVILTSEDFESAEIDRLINFCEEHNLDYKYIPRVAGMISKNFEILDLGGYPVVEVKKTPLDGWGKIVKKLFDLVGSAIFITVFSPLMLCVAIAVRLDSKGPIFYKSDRVGYKGGFYKHYKFRSMKIDACVFENEGDSEALKKEAELIKERNTRQGPLYKIKDDPRVTRVGKFIRKWSLDEFPQFFNVFLGSMSLVGPRPHQPREVAKYRVTHRRLLEVKPGVTGMAQISGRSDLDFEDEARLDIAYIENWSFWKDLVILLKTPRAVVSKRKAD